MRFAAIGRGGHLAIGLLYYLESIVGSGYSGRRYLIATGVLPLFDSEGGEGRREQQRPGDGKGDGVRAGEVEQDPS